VSESSTGAQPPRGRDRSRPRAVPARGRRPAEGASTSERILDAALVSFATRGYDASSLDALASGLEIRKQTILYWFPSKEVLLEAVIDRSAVELSAALEASLSTAGSGWARVEAVVRSVFRLAARRPELLGLVREMGRLGNPSATRLVTALEPMVERASEFLEAQMDAGQMRRHEPRLLLLAIYSTVIGMLTEVEVLRAFGEEPTARSLVRRRTEILELLRSALVTEGS
jgi:AcrR family transcriptional regulator